MGRFSKGGNLKNELEKGWEGGSTTSSRASNPEVKSGAPSHRSEPTIKEGRGSDPALPRSEKMCGGSESESNGSPAAGCVRPSDHGDMAGAGRASPREDGSFPRS